MTISPQKRDELLDITLRFFLEHGARGIGELYTHEPVVDYTPRFLSQFVAALALCGLVHEYGLTSGKTYYTSRLGWIVLTTLHERFHGKAGEGR
jgi:hypothetical protein